MGKISGNTESVKKSVLEYLEGFIDGIYSPGEFLTSGDFRYAALGDL